jgi:hypothetical protein
MILLQRTPTQFRLTDKKIERDSNPQKKQRELPRNMTLHENPFPFPPSPRLLREIRDDWWQMGRDILQQEPNLREVQVAFHNYHPGDRWEHWVVRDPNHRFLQRTIHNGRVERDVPFRY